MKRIEFNVSDETYETVCKVKDELGISFAELYSEAVYYFFVAHKHEISKGVERKHLDGKIRKDQRELFFLQNFYKRLIMQVSFRCKLRAECEHAIVLKIVADAEQYFKVLDEKIQVLVLQDLKFLQQFKEVRYYESWCESRLPDEVKYEAAKKRLLR